MHFNIAINNKIYPFMELEKTPVLLIQ